MDDGYRFVLMCQLSSGGEDEKPYVIANVQIWRDDQHLVTLDQLAQHTRTPEFHDADSVERFATHATRRLARYVDEHLADRIHDGEELHTLENLNKWYPRVLG